MVMSITTTCQPTPALWLCFLHLVGFKYEVVNLKPPKSRKRSHNAGVGWQVVVMLITIVVIQDLQIVYP